MQIFIKKFYSFTPEVIPAITFSSVNVRDDLLRQSKSGDRILYVAVSDENAHEEDRGRILGMAEIGRSKVNSLDLVEDIASIPQDYFEGDRFKWPEAIPMTRAWRFDTTPHRLAVLAKNVVDSQNLRRGITLLSQEDTQSILNVPHHEIDLPKTDTLLSQKIKSAALSSNFDEKWKWQIASLTKGVLSRVKYANGQTIERLVKEKNCTLDEGSLQLLIRELIVKNNYKCAITKQPLLTNEDEGSHWLLPSVDRINSDGNYTADNIQIVSKAANMAKNAVEPEQIETYFAALQINKE